MDLASDERQRKLGHSARPRTTPPYYSVLRIRLSALASRRSTACIISDRKIGTNEQGAAVSRVHSRRFRRLDYSSGTCSPSH